VVLLEARAAAAELSGFKHWKGNAGVDDMRLDSDIKRDVEDELSWDPDLDAIDIGVTVHNGVVTLGGFVGSYAQKSQAKRVAGVVGVANDIEVRLPVVDERPDPEIVRDAVSALKSELPYRPEAVRRERKSASARTPSFHFIPNVA
jgi:BON domain